MKARRITSFSGKYRFLSNFYPAVICDGPHEYPTVEHAFQALKTWDCEQRRMIREAKTPGLARRLGRTVALRSDWIDVRVSVMMDLVRQKFSVEPLRQMLLDTGEAELIEGNTWNDRFWGQCPVGTGNNYLGLILMDVRDELKGEIAP